MRILSLIFVLFATSTALAEPNPTVADEVPGPGSELFCSYRPNYFAVGDPTTRIQLSFRYAIWVTGESGRSCFHPSERDIEFGYTQTSLWRIFDKSLPFEENNYNPELFYREHVRFGWLQWLKVGLEHESNGRAGDISRAWNRLYLSASIGSEAFENTSQWNFRFEPKLWAILPIDLQEGALPYSETIGYARLDMNLWTPETPAGDGLFELTLYKGGVFEFERLTILAGASWNFWKPLRQSAWWGFTPDIYVQYFQGWAETLENSVFFSRSLRFGIRARH